MEFIKNSLGFEVSSSYYSNISEWADWWRGFHKPFHRFFELEGEKKVQRDMYTLKMAKKISEDWATILLNEKTTITVDDEQSSVFLMGDENEANGGVFGATNFWSRANALVEKAFYSGTGAIVLHCSNMAISDSNAIVSDDGAQIELCFISAQNIIPLSVANEEIIDVGFVSEYTKAGTEYSYLETHTRDKGKYTVRNFVFKNDNGSLTPAELPEGVLPEITYNTGNPLFAIIRPNIVNQISSGSGMGVSVFANAIDNLKGVDLAFNNFCRDLKLGGKKVFINQQLTHTTPDGATIAPDDVAQQLFSVVGDDIIDGKKYIQEYNPSLRTDENTKAIQAQLDYLSFKCGLGTHHYRFDGGTIVTATQYTGDKQDLVQNASRHYIVIERALVSICRAILWAGREICRQTVNPDAKISVNFDDSYIIDKETERQRDLQEIRDGIRQPWEYRVKWFGEDEDTAKQMIPKSEADFNPFNLTRTNDVDA